MFEQLRARIALIRQAPSLVAERAAPRIQAEQRRASTTRRGNVPQYPPLGPLVPITATPKGDAIVVRAAAWVMKKAVQKGQPDRWLDIVREEAQKVLGP